LGDVYKKLLAKGAVMATKTAISTAFPPFKVAGWISSGVGAASKLRFDDLAFAPAESALLPQASSYLAEVGNLLTKRPGVRIKVTGFGTLADLKSNSESDVALNALAEADRTKVMALATARAEAIKQYFVQTHSINPERLFVSSPEFDGKPGKSPRAEISL
jgi:outer membrane protein OmpA-like peptidoglycan-associated protein